MLNLISYNATVHANVQCWASYFETACQTTVQSTYDLKQLNCIQATLP